MNARYHRRFRMIQPQRFGVRKIRILRTKYGNAIAFESDIFAEKSCSVGCRRQLRRIFRVGQKTDVRSGGKVEAGGSGDLKIR